MNKSESAEQTADKAVQLVFTMYPKLTIPKFVEEVSKIIGDPPEGQKELIATLSDLHGADITLKIVKGRIIPCQEK